MCKLISRKKGSVKSPAIDKSFDVISSLTNNRIPPPLQLRSRQ